MPRLDVPYYSQEEHYTCGPACLRMVAHFLGHVYSEHQLADLCGTTILGTGRMGLARGAVELGFGARPVECSGRQDVAEYLRQSRPIIAIMDPALLYRAAPGFAHSVVIVGLDGEDVAYHDPKVGPDLVMWWHQFEGSWREHQGKGVVLWRT